MPITREDIINQALVVLGEAPLQSFDEETPISQSVSLLYGLTLNSLFQAEWHFSRVNLQLSQVSETPLNGFKYAYELPNDMIAGTAHKALQNLSSPHNLLRDYTISGNRLYASYGPVYLQYNALKEPEQWPPLFYQLVVYALAAALAVPITGSTSLSEHFRGLAFGTPSQNGRGGLFAQAMDADCRQADTPTPMGYHAILFQGR